MGSGAAAEAGCGARCGPGEWRGRAGVDDDGGAAETSSTTADGAAGRGWATEARSKMNRTDVRYI